MIRGLLAKELRQSGLAFVFVVVAPIAAYVMIGGHGRLRAVSGGGFEEVRLLLSLFVPLACLVLSQLLIATEFRHKTQLFLEGLPLPRWRMLVVKFALGGALVGLGVGCVLGLAWWQARGTEAMTPRFAALLALKTGGWAAFMFTLTFAHAFLGRYRVFFAMLLFIGFVSCLTLELPISRFGPFALIDARFAFERFVWPGEALAVTAALVAALTAFAFTLGLIRDATLSTMLAEKMSAREKLFLTMFFFVLLLVVGETFERRKSSTAVLMPGASEAQAGAVRVLASAAVDAPTREETAALQALVDDLGTELDAMVAYLGCRTFPAVFIVHRRDLDGGTLASGDLKPGQGVLVRVNVTAPEFSRDALLGWLVRATLVAHTHGLLERERNAWVLDGFEWWWPRTARGTQTAWTPETQRLAREAATKGFTDREVRAWLRLRHDAGAEKARALAGSGLAWMAERHGPEKTRAFLAARLGPAEPGDGRAWVRDQWRSTPARLHAAIGITQQAFVAEWRAALPPPP